MWFKGRAGKGLGWLRSSSGGLSPPPAQGSEGPWAWGRAPQRGRGLCRAQLAVQIPQLGDSGSLALPCKVRDRQLVFPSSFALGFLREHLYVPAGYLNRKSNFCTALCGLI